MIILIIDIQCLKSVRESTKQSLSPTCKEKLLERLDMYKNAALVSQNYLILNFIPIKMELSDNCVNYISKGCLLVFRYWTVKTKIVLMYHHILIVFKVTDVVGIHYSYQSLFYIHKNVAYFLDGYSISLTTDNFYVNFLTA